MYYGKKPLENFSDSQSDNIQLQSCAGTSPEPSQSEITSRRRAAFLALHRYGSAAHLPDSRFHRVDGEKVVPAFAKLGAAVDKRDGIRFESGKGCVPSLALCVTNLGKFEELRCHRFRLYFLRTGKKNVALWLILLPIPTPSSQ